MNETEKTKTSEPARRAVRGSISAAGLIIAVGIAIVANLIAAQLFVRYDMTENKIYTLSEASREAVSGLDEPIAVKIFVSPDMPAPLHTLSERLNDLFAEYEADSGSRLTYQIITPADDDPQAEEAAQGYGCEKVAIGQQSEDEVSLRAVYKCVAIVQGEKTEVIRDLRVTGNPEVDNIEYDITKAILNLSTSAPKKVGFVAGFGGPAADPQFAQGASAIFEQLYGKLIEPASIDLSAPGATIPDDVVALVLLDPSETFSESARYALDQFLQRGGSIGWFQSSSAPDEKMMQQLGAQMGQNMPEFRRAVDPGLNQLFETYGVRIRSDLVLDPGAGMTSLVVTNQGLAQITNPAVFQVSTIERSLPFLTNLPPIVLPTPSSVELTSAATEAEAIRTWEALASSAEAKRIEDAPITRSYEALIDAQATGDPQVFLLGAALQGPFVSAYPDGPPEGASDAQRYQGEPRPGRIFALGSGDFWAPAPQIGFDQRLAGIGQRLLFSSMEWLAQDNALSTIRDKKLPRFIGEVDDGIKSWIQLINIALVPLSFALIGLVMYYRRRARRASLSA